MHGSRVFILSMSLLAGVLSSEKASGFTELPTLDAVKKLPVEDPVRVQMAKLHVFLDRANFRPGRIDALPGEFTEKALTRWRTAGGLEATALPDLSAIETPFKEYTVTKEDMAWIGSASSNPAQMAKMSRTAYGSVWEMMAEKFHVSENYLRELNTELTKNKVGEGTTFRVVDVEPFAMKNVTDLRDARLAAEKAGKAKEEARKEEELAARKAEKELAENAAVAAETSAETSAEAQTPESPNEPAAAASAEPAPEPATPAHRLRLLRAERILEVYELEGDRLVRSYPITVSTRVPVPPGTWKIMNNVMMPVFRYDKSVLKDGTPSNNYFNIPPGPNNFVGIVWMGINRRSTGLHGTNSPDQIGRSESSGCIRLANWDAYDLCLIAHKGTEVKVE